MCKENIAVAICAPSDPPTLTFTCGKLHLIASSRQVCDKALGSCVCFFGSCGSIEKAARPEAFELGDIAKARCVACTAQEDQVGERRHGIELAESPLLVRSAIQSPTALAHFEMDVKILWNHAKECPFHTGSCAVSSAVTSATSASPESLEILHDCADSNPEISIESQFSVISDPQTATSRTKDQSSPQNPAEALVSNGDVTDESPMASEKQDNGLTLSVGLVTSRWGPSPAGPGSIADQNMHSAAVKNNERDIENSNPKGETNINEHPQIDRKVAHNTAQLLGSGRVSLLGAAKKFLERS